jgi:8-oxo-dGTP pyrophosphatase MutT (NUDIX family)
MTDVVAGFAYREGLVLLGKRKASGKRGGLWEMPGGKVEQGESHVIALAREWKEELGIDIGVGKFIGNVDLALEIDFTVFLYEVTFPLTITPLTLDHEELQWVGLKHAIEYMPCSPALYFHYPKVKSYLWEAYRKTPG